MKSTVKLVELTILIFTGRQILVALIELTQVAQDIIWV